MNNKEMEKIAKEIFKLPCKKCQERELTILRLKSEVKMYKKSKEAYQHLAADNLKTLLEM